MSINKKLLVLGLIILTNLSIVSAQDGSNTATNVVSLGMPEVYMLASNSATVNLTLTPTTAGNAVVSSVADSTARVLISSVVAEAQTRTLTAKISAGSVPAGTYLNLVAQTPNATFVGTAGTFAAEIQLSATDQNIITGIGTCYSGTSSDDGYKMKYTYGVPESTEQYDLIRASGGSAVTITFTLSAGI